jgi:branched-chain amino acid transport system ATP-binding protein
MRALDARMLSKSFGGLRAVDQVSFCVEQHEIVGVIGPNGAGKSTLFNLLAGFLPPDAGEIDLFGQNIVGLPAHRIACLGLVKTFQLVRPFGSMDLGENLMVPLLRRGFSRAESERQSLALLVRFGLEGLEGALPGELPYALRRRLEIARAVAASPRLLLLDEALAGLTATELGGLMDILVDLRRSGCTLLLIEHVMEATMRLCDRVIVLHQGRVIANGAPLEVTRDAGVVEAYLGANL